jgi:predicted acetyltransferase
VAALAIVATVKMQGEEQIIEKAERNWFYHAIAKLSSSKYKGYYPSEEEVEAHKKFAKEEVSYDTHPVGSYLKMRKECNDMLKTAGNFHGYNIAASTGGAGIGFAVMLVFAAIIALGVAYC